MGKYEQKDGPIDKPWKDITGHESDAYRRARAGSTHTSFIAQRDAAHAAKVWDWGVVESLNKMGVWITTHDSVHVITDSRHSIVEYDVGSIFTSPSSLQDLEVGIIQRKIMAE